LEERSQQQANEQTGQGAKMHDRSPVEAVYYVEAVHLFVFQENPIDLGIPQV